MDVQDADEVVGGVEDAGYGDLLAEIVGSEALIIEPEEAGVRGVAQENFAFVALADCSGDKHQGSPEGLL